jgi:hypothetical protein
MKADTAARLAERAMRISDALDEMARDIEANEPDDESARVRHAIGRVMWAIYYEILKPTFEEYPAVEPEVRTDAGPATKIGPRGSLAASADRFRLR